MAQLSLFDSILTIDKSHSNPADLPKTVSEYFAGIGLVRLGLEKAGWNVIFANDFDPQKYEMYSAYFDDAEKHYVTDDIFNLDHTSIPDTTLATASFPCIDLSLAGNQNGLSGKHSSAFWGFIRLLEEKGTKRPPIVLVENVPGWLTSNKGEDFRVTIKALNDLGYACDLYSIDAMRFTPQSRLRIFVIGVMLEERSSGVDILLQRPMSLASRAVKNAILSNLDLKWHLLELPPLPSYDRDLKDAIEIMDDDDPRWWSELEVKRHLAMMSSLHRDRIEVLAAGQSREYKTIFRRRRNGEVRAEVRLDNKAGCLRTARGGSSRQIIIAAGCGIIKMRHMTPREYARLQGVPDDYPLPKNTIQALTGFGDAVCVPVIAWIAENALNQLFQTNLQADHLLSLE